MSYSSRSPKQQFEVIAASEGSALSPTLRKCCMDCPGGGDLVILQQVRLMVICRRLRE